MDRPAGGRSRLSRVELVLDGEPRWWTEGVAPVTLCTRGGPALPIRPGDRLLWRYGYYHYSQGMVSSPVPLDAWVESVDGGVRRLLHTEVGDGYDDFGERDRGRLVDALNALSVVADVAVEEAAKAPHHDRLVGVVARAGAVVPETPAGAPVCYLAVDGMDDAVPLLPTLLLYFAPQELNPDQRAELSALRTVLEDSGGARVAVSGAWDRARFFSCFAAERHTA